jgi:hypothetical protein
VPPLQAFCSETLYRVAAVQMAILFQVVLTIVGIARAQWGDARSRQLPCSA